ncbi:MAG: hypothetical protein QXP77_01355 [Candidatus Aenigmatarchaeota archaeon]
MKSQISIEFLLLISVLIFLAGVSFLASGTFQTNTFEDKVYSSAREICKKISSEIDIAIRIGDGYRREFSVDEKLFGDLDYSIEIENYTVKIMWDDRVFSCNVLAENVNGVVKKGKNLIKNQGGEIYVE